MNKDIFAAIGNKSPAGVNADDALAICDRIKGRGAPQPALVIRNVIKRMFEYAISRQVATTNPAQQLVARFIATPQSRTRVLTPEEIRTVYASDMSRHYKLALHLTVSGKESGRQGAIIPRRPNQNPNYPAV